LVLHPGHGVAYFAVVDPPGRRWVVGFDWRNGVELWKTQLSEPESFIPVGVAVDVVVCADGSGEWPRLLGLDRRTGRVRWKEKEAIIAEAGSAGTTVSGGAIYQCTVRSVRRVDPVTGEQVWIRDFGKAFVGSVGQPYPPAIANNRVFAQLADATGTHVICFDSGTGRTLWQWKTKWVVLLDSGTPHELSSLAADNEHVFACVPAGPQRLNPNNPTIPLPPPMRLSCWQSGDGKLLWQRDISWSTIDYELFTHDGVVLVNLGTGHGVKAFSVQDGTLRWHWEDQAHAIHGPWSVTQSGLLLVSELHKEAAWLRVLDLSDGSTRGLLRLARRFFVWSIWPLPNDDAVVVFGSEEGRDDAQILLVSLPPSSR